MKRKKSKVVLSRLTGGCDMLPSGRCWPDVHLELKLLETRSAVGGRLRHRERQEDNMPTSIHNLCPCGDFFSGANRCSLKSERLYYNESDWVRARPVREVDANRHSRAPDPPACCLQNVSFGSRAEIQQSCFETCIVKIRVTVFVYLAAFKIHICTWTWLRTLISMTNVHLEVKGSPWLLRSSLYGLAKRWWSGNCLQPLG